MCLAPHLVTIRSLNWDRDMVLWDSPEVFKNDAPFNGGADDYLRLLVEEIVSAVERQMGPPICRGIAGYSLAGLFAVYATARMRSHVRPACLARSGFKGSGSMYLPHARAPAGLCLILPG